jgi:type I restriction enzyme S subunit
MVEEMKIAKNNTLNVPKGYKQTEVGIIPEDWEVKKLGEIAEIKMGQSPSSEFYNTSQKGLPLIQGNADIKNRKTIIRSYTSQITKKCKKNDIIMSVRAPVGEIAVATFDACIGRGVCAISHENQFLYHYLIFIEPQWAKHSTGSTFDSVNSDKIRKLEIPLPPTRAEQTAIATALSDMDALIEKLEQLIQKKQHIKQGAMQELLKPKKGWEEKTMDKIGKTYGGLSGKSKKDFENGTKPYIPFMNVMSNPIIDTTYFDYVNISSSENQNRVQKGDLFFNTSSETPEEVGMCSVLLEEVGELYLNSFCFGFRFHKDVKDNGLFLAYFFRSNYGRQKLFLLAQGATRYNLSKSNFLKLKLQLPQPKEQTRIAQILSDMDSEIEQLETQLSKYKMLKTGMMQELLTGKKRLV